MIIVGILLGKGMLAGLRVTIEIGDFRRLKIARGAAVGFFIRARARMRRLSFVWYAMQLDMLLERLFVVEGLGTARIGTWVQLVGHFLGHVPAFVPVFDVQIEILQESRGVGTNVAMELQ